MNALISILIIPFLAATTSFSAAQQSASEQSSLPALGTTSISRLAQAEANYATGLESANRGLIESSLYYALQLRLAYPERKFPRLERAVDCLLASGHTVGIRYKALLTSSVFAAPRLIDRDAVRHLNDADSFFAAVAVQLDNKLLVSKHE